MGISLCKMTFVMRFNMCIRSHNPFLVRTVSFSHFAGEAFWKKIWFQNTYSFWSENILLFQILAAIQESLSYSSVLTLLFRTD